MSELTALLRNNRIFDSFFSHVSLIQPKGKFSLWSRDTLESFWALYQKAVIDGTVVGIAEVPQQFIPVLVDVDLQFAPSCVKRDNGFFYSDEFVRAIAGAYQKVLREFIPCTDEMLYCAWLSKPEYVKEIHGEPVIKNGFHLHFFNLFVDRVDLETRLIPHVFRELNESLDPALLDGVLNPRDFLDKKAVGNTWLLYGSSKSEEQKPYLLEAVLDARLERVDADAAFSTTSIFDANEEKICFSDYRFFLPRIFSIVPGGRRVYDIPRIECIRDYMEFRPPRPDKTVKPRTHEEIKEETRIARELVKILSPQRAVGHDDWMRVGWALYNITDGGEQGLDIWISFSTQTDDHDEARCIYEWTRMQNRNSITLGTLKFYARTDNEPAYVNFMSRVETTKKINVTEKGLADLMMNHVHGEFVYCKKKWFQFVGHYWQIADEGINLVRRLEEVLVPLLRKMKQNAARGEEDDDDDQEEEENNNGASKKIKGALARLNHSAFMRSIVEWCKIRFHDQEFENNLDKNRYLIGFNNGVYDLQQHLFRKGDPSDMITNHMPIDYQVFRETDDKVIETRQFFEKVFPNPNIRRYFLDIMSEIFVGYNHRKHVYFLTGDGDNSKSMTQMFFEKMLGRLSIKAPTTIVTSKKPAVGGTSEELARAGGGTRAIWLEEPNIDEEINEGIFKQLSGNDTFYARGLYQSGKEIEPMFTLFIICNALPHLRHGGDKATWNRIRVIRFESTFTNNAPKDSEEQLRLKRFPKDPTLDQRIPQLTSALAWILLEHFKLPKIEDPPEVLEATEEFRGANDLYAQFISECFVPEPESDVRDVQAIEYFKDFLRFSQNRNVIVVPPTSEFAKTMCRYLGEMDDHRWHGYRMQPPRGMAYKAETEAAENTIPEGGARDFMS